MASDGDSGKLSLVGVRWHFIKKKKKSVCGATLRIWLVMCWLHHVAMVTGFIFPHYIVVLDALLPAV